MSVDELEKDTPAEIPEEKGDDSEKSQKETTSEEESTSFYKKQAEETQAKLDKAEYTLGQNRLKEKEGKSETPEKKEGLSDEEIDARFEAKMLERDSKKFRQSLSTVIEDADKRAQVEYYLDNRVTPSGNLEEDLQLAMTLANAGRMETINGELKLALKNKPKGADLPGTQPEGEQGKQLSEADKAFLSKLGLTESDIAEE